MCVGSLCLHSVYLEELLENVTAVLLSGFGSFGVKPFQLCCESNIRETAFTDAASVAHSSPPQLFQIFCASFTSC